MFERRLFSYLDWALISAVLVIVGIGLAMIYSATYDPVRGRLGAEFVKQSYAVPLGLAAMTVALLIDYRRLADHSLLLYGAVALLLLYVLLFGFVAGGARRWIALGPVNLQPSEFAKIALALVVATFFAESRRGASDLRDLGLASLFLVGLGLLIAKQPDLGTAVTLVPIFLGVAFAAGLRLKWLAVIALVAVVTAPVAWSFALKDYQKTRIQTFLDPEQDARVAGYQKIQARISVGSVGFAG